jgi:hypothetical protein
MTLQDVIQLKQKGAKFRLVLAKTFSNRCSHSDYDLYLQLKTVLNLKDTPTTSSIAVEAPKHYMTLERLLTFNGLSFDFLNDSDKPISTTSVLSLEPLAGRSMCRICSKTNFDDSNGCKNPSIFSVGVGDWVCNLQVKL